MAMLVRICGPRMNKQCVYGFSVGLECENTYDVLSFLGQNEVLQTVCKQHQKVTVLLQVTNLLDKSGRLSVLWSFRRKQHHPGLKCDGDS